MLCKICILKSFVKLYKTINESISCNIAEFFHSQSYQRYSKGTRGALGHSWIQGTWALDHLRQSGTRRALGYSGTQDNWALGQSRH